LIILEHGEKPSPPGALRLTFNYQHALYLARKKTRRLEALQWLCETFRKRACMCDDPLLSELTVNRISYSCNGICDLRLIPQGVVVYVSTDLLKFHGLPSLLLDRNELKKVLKGKHSGTAHITKPSRWKKLGRSNPEKILEKLIRGDHNQPGLGEEVFTFQSIPRWDIVRIELAQQIQQAIS
jgi:hypothetical protein